LDDYYITQLRKLNQALDIFSKEDCHCVIQVGDMFDSPTVSNKIIASIISTFKIRTFEEDFEFYACWGQHDIAGHSAKTLPNSPLSVLEASGVLKLTDFDTAIQINKDKFLYGSSFGEDVPEVENKKAFNILATHKMIGDRELYPGQELENPKAFLKKYPDFNLVVCGDYHYRFLTEYDGRVILNPGALMRKTISKFDLEHKPGIFIVDTDDMSTKFSPVDIEPVEKVFDLSREEKCDNQKLLDFITNLAKNSNSNCNWKSLLCKILKDMNCSEDVKNIIDSSIEEVVNHERHS
jgi:DNA repair exonuclease SbcCD nuclease subunit